MRNNIIYSLNDVISHLGLKDFLKAEILKELGIQTNCTPKLINDHLTGKCLAQIYAEQGIDCEIMINHEVNGMSKLPSFHCSTQIRPDVLVTICDGVKLVLGFAGEVLSSPMRETEFKAIFWG